MSRIEEILKSHPRDVDVDEGVVLRAIEALVECAQVCASCSDACLSEEDPTSLRRCIRLDLDCADLCTTLARMLGRRSEVDPMLARAAVDACVVACEAVALECDKHADAHDHCRVCAEACRACADACRAFMESLAPADAPSSG